jgi:hypothetical protein
MTRRVVICARCQMTVLVVARYIGAVVKNERSLDSWNVGSLRASLETRTPSII